MKGAGKLAKWIAKTRKTAPKKIADTAALGMGAADVAKEGLMKFKKKHPIMAGAAVGGLSGAFGAELLDEDEDEDEKTRRVKRALRAVFRERRSRDDDED